MAELVGASNEGLAALTEFFVNDGTLGDTLLRVAELACDEASADMAAITMLVEGKAATGVCTDPEARDVDATQYSTGSGPCLDAFRRQAIYRIDSTTDDDRWPEFARVAAAHGIASTLSLPVIARGEGVAALNLYSKTPSKFDGDCAERIAVFVRQAAIVLANAQVYWDARSLSENLTEAMRSRATIDYAIGIVMAGGGRSPEEAFQVLVRASQRENRKLRDIAEEMVVRTASPTEPK